MTWIEMKSHEMGAASEYRLKLLCGGRNLFKAITIGCTARMEPSHSW